MAHIFYLRQLIAALTVILFAAPALAQTTCTPEKLNAAVDTFAMEPFSARSWRVLNGLGDPELAPEGIANSGWAASDTWQKTVVTLAPDMPELAQVSYDCRLNYPLEVLNARNARLGAKHPYLQQWLKAQARVLKACDSNAVGTDLTLPVPFDVAPDLVQLQNDDRAYQNASIAFYRDKPRAVSLFKNIANSQSVHRAAARYNVANLFASANNVSEARKEVSVILADPSVASVHAITRELAGYIANLEDTPDGWTALLDQTVATLSQQSGDITKSNQNMTEYSMALYDIDYAGVRAKRDDWWIAGTLPADATISKALVDASRKHPMVLWMMTGQSINARYDRAPWAYSGLKWQEWTTSYATRAMALQPAANGISPLPKSLIAALYATNDEASRKAMWDMAKAALAKAGETCGVAPETAAASELVLQATRLSATAGAYEEAYGVLVELPIKSSAAYVDRILPKLMQHVLARGDAEEGRRLRDRLLTPQFFAGVTGENREYRFAPYSDFLTWVAEDEAAWKAGIAMSTSKLQSPLLNLQTSKTLRRLQEDAMFSAEQKALLSRAAWTRDYAVGLKPNAANTEDMLRLNPLVKAEFDAVKVQYPTLKSDQLWLLTILRNPRFGILVNAPGWTDAIETPRTIANELDQYDHNDKNWWCPLETDRHLGIIRDSFDEDSGAQFGWGYGSDVLKPVLDETLVTAAKTARDRLLKNHPMVKAIDLATAKRLSQAPSAPKLLTTAALRWAKAGKANDAAGEALSLAVRATRFGCNWHGSHKAYSKPAQELLKSKYAGTHWLAKTPYWFDCVNNTWDANFNRVVNCKPQQWPKQAPLQ